MLKTFAAVLIAASMLTAPAFAQGTAPAPSAPATQAIKAPAAKVVKAKKHHKVKKHVHARVHVKHVRHAARIGRRTCAARRPSSATHAVHVVRSAPKAAHELIVRAAVRHGRPAARLASCRLAATC